MAQCIFNTTHHERLKRLLTIDRKKAYTISNGTNKYNKTRPTAQRAAEHIVYSALGFDYKSCIRIFHIEQNDTCWK